jgi:hypothetical protein
VQGTGPLGLPTHVSLPPIYPSPLDMTLLPKPTRTRKQERRAEKRLQQRLTARVRDAVRTRDRRCRICGVLFSEGRPGELHHLRFRSQGGETSTQNTVLLCSRCHHEEIHGRRIDLVPVDELGADGRLEIQTRFPCE